MGIYGFFSVEWVDCVRFPQVKSKQIRKCHLAIDVLSFAIGYELKLNQSILLARLMYAINQICNLYQIDKIALFVDGPATHNLKRQEQERRRKQSGNPAIRAQLSYVKNVKWSPYIIDGICNKLNLDRDCVKIFSDQGEADFEIFRRIDEWKSDEPSVDNLVLSTDSDVFFMSFFCKSISGFVRRLSKSPLLLFRTPVTDLTRTRMIKHAILNKTDFYGLAYGGQYVENSPQDVWKIEASIEGIANLTENIVDFLRSVLLQKSCKRIEPSNEDYNFVISVIARRVWFIMTTCGFHVSIDEDECLSSSCSKRQLVNVLIKYKTSEIVNRVLKNVQLE